MKASRAFRVVAPCAIVVVALVLASCAPPTTPPQEEPPHYLTISNNSSYDLCFVTWKDAEGRSYDFAPDNVYDSVLERNVEGMLPGSEFRLEVAIGNAPMRFFFAGGGSGYETVDTVFIGIDSEESTFTFSDSTLIQKSD